MLCGVCVITLHAGSSAESETVEAQDGESSTVHRQKGKKYKMRGSEVIDKAAIYSLTKDRFSMQTNNMEYINLLLRTAGFKILF